MRGRGMTYKQIAEWYRVNQGLELSPASIAVAVSRAGKAGERERYPEHLPWTVGSKHNRHYAARMLRLLGRRDSGKKLNDGDEQRLDSWLSKLRRENALVAYLPDDFPDDGFVYVDANQAAEAGLVDKAWPSNGIPIIPPRASKARVPSQAR